MPEITLIRECSWYKVLRVLCGLEPLKAPPTRPDIDYYKLTLLFPLTNIGKPRIHVYT